MVSFKEKHWFCVMLNIKKKVFPKEILFSLLYFVLWLQFGFILWHPMSSFSYKENEMKLNLGDLPVHLPLSGIYWLVGATRPGECCAPLLL